MHASATPVSLAPTSERFEALDTLRGVAVFVILLANVLVFFGLFMLPSDRAAALPTARADAVVAFVEKVLVDGKFYSIYRRVVLGDIAGVARQRGESAGRARYAGAGVRKPQTCRRRPCGRSRLPAQARAERVMTFRARPLDGEKRSD